MRRDLLLVHVGLVTIHITTLDVAVHVQDLKQNKNNSKVDKLRHKKYFTCEAYFNRFFLSRYLTGLLHLKFPSYKLKACD